MATLRRFTRGRWIALGRSAQRPFGPRWVTPCHASPLYGPSARGPPFCQRGSADPVGYACTDDERSCKECRGTTLSVSARGCPLDGRFAGSAAAQGTRPCISQPFHPNVQSPEVLSAIKDRLLTPVDASKSTTSFGREKPRPSPGGASLPAGRKEELAATAAGATEQLRGETRCPPAAETDTSSAYSQGKTACTPAIPRRATIATFPRDDPGQPAGQFGLEGPLPVLRPDSSLHPGGQAGRPRPHDHHGRNTRRTTPRRPSPQPPSTTHTQSSSVTKTTRRRRTWRAAALPPSAPAVVRSARSSPPVNATASRRPVMLRVPGVPMLQHQTASCPRTTNCITVPNATCKRQRGHCDCGFCSDGALHGAPRAREPALSDGQFL